MSMYETEDGQQVNRQIWIAVDTRRVTRNEIVRHRLQLPDRASAVRTIQIFGASTIIRW
jgi:hypothetical protein